MKSFLNFAFQVSVSRLDSTEIFLQRALVFQIAVARFLAALFFDLADDFLHAAFDLMLVHRRLREIALRIERCLFSVKPSAGLPVVGGHTSERGPTPMRQLFYECDACRIAS